MTLLVAPTASAQWTVHDPANLVSQIKQIHEMVKMVKHQKEHRRIIQEARRAAARAKGDHAQQVAQWYQSKDELERRFGVDLDGDVDFLRLDYANAGGNHQVNPHIFSHNMSSAQFQERFQMESVVSNPATHNQKNREMLMSNVTTHMQKTQRLEKSIVGISNIMDELSEKMKYANDSTRSALQAEVVLLDTKREIFYGLVDISRANLDAAMEAQRIYEQQQATLREQSLRDALHSTRTQ